jgi:hypothetical protein
LNILPHCPTTNPLTPPTPPPGQGVKELRTEFRKKVVQKVPVEWVGVATEVRVVGDFDGWTRGVDLSQAQEDVMSDSVSGCV